jgi:hypothetical protein
MGISGSPEEMVKSIIRVTSKRKGDEFDEDKDAAEDHQPTSKRQRTMGQMQECLKVPTRAAPLTHSPV